MVIFGDKRENSSRKEKGSRVPQSNQTKTEYQSADETIRRWCAGARALNSAANDDVVQVRTAISEDSDHHPPSG